ncbi:MAG: cytochrome c biogenesis protein ResB [Dehalococcoidia bacterium]
MASVETAQRVLRPARGSELLFWCWRLLASGQFALALIGFLAVAGLVAVLLPQIPSSIEGSPAAVDAWLEAERGKFGPFTESMHRVGLFNVVSTWWFLAGLGLLAASVIVYSVDRSVSVWRNVARPRELVPNSFFESAANRLALATPERADAAASVEAVLRSRRFRVRQIEQAGATYLFADRFAWAQFGTFASHLALVLFLVGAVVSQTGGYTQALLIAEGTSSPVFPVSHPNQMQVEVVDAVGRFDDETGIPSDYRSQLVIYQRGEEVARGVATVNDPLSYGGYRFHQAGYFGEGAALRVRDAGSGNTLYSEVLALEELVPAPSIRVNDADGDLLLNDVIVPTDFVEETSGTLITVPGDGREFWVGVRQDAGAEEAWSLIVYERENEEARFVLPEGESQRAGGLEWSFIEAVGLPSVVAPGVPGDSARSLVVLSETDAGEPYLTLLGPAEGSALTLSTDEPVVIGGREYAFEGRREFAGIEVRKDPGANFIWAAAGLLLFGLVVTFYLPRLRLWGRVTRDETVIVGLAERRGVFQSETKHLLQELGAATIEAEPEKEKDAERPRPADD